MENKSQIQAMRRCNATEVQNDQIKVHWNGQRSIGSYYVENVEHDKVRIMPGANGRKVSEPIIKPTSTTTKHTNWLTCFVMDSKQHSS